MLYNKLSFEPIAQLVYVRIFKFIRTHTRTNLCVYAHSLYQTNMRGGI